MKQKLSLMISYRVVKKAIICCILLLCNQSEGQFLDIIQDDRTHFFDKKKTQDSTTSRANTLLDDADDIQRQLDNEARDRVGNLKTVWVFHDPSNINNQYMKQKSNPNNIIIRLKRKLSKKEPIDAYGYQNTYNKNSSDECDSDCQCGCHIGVGPDDIKNQLSENRDEELNTPSLPEWSFLNQTHWHEEYKDCGGRAQSPVFLPVEGLIRARGARKIIFSNYDVPADNLTVVNDGKRVVMYGHWPQKNWPLVYGGAAHSRRYLFHSLSVYWPSEHPVGNVYYPMETQLLHISSEYATFDEAVNASSRDPMAFLGIVNIYKYSHGSHRGLMTILQAASKCRLDKQVIRPKSLSYFSTPFKEYVCYFGSLTTPPCSESVLWLVRRRSLPISRRMKISLPQILGAVINADMLPKVTTRFPQPLNDRKVYLFLQK